MSFDLKSVTQKPRRRGGANLTLPALAFNGILMFLAVVNIIYVYVCVCVLRDQSFEAAESGVCIFVHEQFRIPH